MRKVLGIDLGTNTIGWATIVDNDDTPIASGVQVFPLSRQQARHYNRQKRRSIHGLICRLTAWLNALATGNKITVTHIIHGCLIGIVCITTLLAIISNWQFWLNVAFSALIALLSILKK